MLAATPTTEVQANKAVDRSTSDATQREGIIVEELALESAEGPHDKYRTMTWWNASFVMVAETISLGILSLPASVAVLGFLPGALLTLLVGLCSLYTGYVLWQFKMAHPTVMSYADAGQLIAGTCGRWIVDVVLTLKILFIMAAHVLTFSVMLNVLTEHGACTVRFTVAGMVVCMVFTLPRAFKTTSYLSIVSCLSILTAAFLALINISLRQQNPGTTYLVTPLPLTSVGKGALAVSNMMVSFTGHMAYFNIMHEMLEPRKFPRALCLTQLSTLSLYLIVGIVIYYFAGAEVKSPALTSASPLVSKIAYGIAIPTIIVAGVITAMVAAKRIYRAFLARDAEGKEVEDDRRSWVSWVSVVIGLWIVAWIIANAIPNFSQLIGLLGAALASWICFGFPAIAWLTMNWKREGKTWADRVVASYGVNWKKVALTALTSVNLCLIGMTVVLCGTGIYGSAVEIMNNPPERRPFSCASNA